MSKGAQCVKPTRSTRTIKNHAYTPLQLTQKHNHLKSSRWTSLPSYHHHEDTTRSSPSLTTTAPRRHCSSPVTRPSLVKESRSYTYNTRTLTMDSPND